MARRSIIKRFAVMNNKFGDLKIMTKKEIAQSLSAGNYEKVADNLADNIEWNMYEEADFIKGKQAFVEFAEKVGAYFRSVTTKFEMDGIIEDENKIAIYGRAEFIRDGKTVNKINSCDVYEFDADGKVGKVHSFCNSKRPS
jgi:hypothetical protein